MMRLKMLAMDDGQLATDPPVSEKQRRAMYAARAGKSTLGIPKSVGEEFVGKKTGADRGYQEYEGEAAFKAGRPPTANPYPNVPGGKKLQNSKAANDWFAGYFAAKAEAEKSQANPSRSFTSMLGGDDFKESDHPRAPQGSSTGGEFTSGGGGGSSSAAVSSPGAKKAKPFSSGRVKETRSTPAKEAKVAAPEAQEKGHDGVVNYLRTVSGFQKMPEGQISKTAFVLKNGVPYTVNDKTFQGKRDPAHMCYMNATKAALADEDRTYVEGYITVHGVPIEHAWTVDKTGQVYDSTIKPDDAVTGYFGVPFSTEYLLKSTLKNKVYGLLGHGSRKTRDALLGGQKTNFKADVDVDAMSDETIKTRLSFADRTARSMPETDKISTPERDQLRAKVADDLYNKNIENRSHNKEATIILGLPGSGKSTFAAHQLEHALEIEGDNAKAMLPEFEGGVGAFSVHEEASAIMRKVLRRAVTNGDNIVWPRIDSPEKIVTDVKALKDAGYKVHLRLIDTSPEVSMKSAISRYLKKGRYVSPLQIMGFGDKPRESYEVAKATGLLESTGVYTRGHTGAFEASQ